MSDNGILTGVRIILMVSRIGTENTVASFGLLTDVSITDGIDWGAIKVIGSLPTAEFAPLDYNVTVDAGKYIRLPGYTPSSGGQAVDSSGNLREEGIFPKYGSSDIEFLNNVLVMSSGLTGQIQLIDTNISIGTIEGLLPAQRVLSTGANQFVNNKLTFVARLFRDNE